MVYPNPFKSNTFISFSIKNEGHIKLEVLNLQGQKVRTIANNRFPAGSYRLVWDGNDDENESVISGNYFIKLVFNNKIIEMRKLIKSK